MEYMITESEVLSTLHCPSCQVLFALPQSMEDQRRSDSKDFYCPNGHPMSFREGDRERLQRERAAHDQTKAALRDATEQKLALERRLKHGVCPCCRRTFQNLSRHIQHMHPEYGPPPMEPPPERKRGRPPKERRPTI